MPIFYVTFTEVKVRSETDRLITFSTRQENFKADTFAQAEQQALAIKLPYEAITQIEIDFDAFEPAREQHGTSYHVRPTLEDDGA